MLSTRAKKVERMLEIFATGYLSKGVGLLANRGARFIIFFKKSLALISQYRLMKVKPAKTVRKQIGEKTGLWPAKISHKKKKKKKIALTGSYA